MDLVVVAENICWILTQLWNIFAMISSPWWWDYLTLCNDNDKEDITLTSRISNLYCIFWCVMLTLGNVEHIQIRLQCLLCLYFSTDVILIPHVSPCRIGSAAACVVGVHIPVLCRCVEWRLCVLHAERHPSRGLDQLLDQKRTWAVRSLFARHFHCSV